MSEMIVYPDRRRAWDQQEGESDKAYERFLIYLRLGPKRTLEAAEHSIYTEAEREAWANGTKRKKKRGENWVAEYAAWDWQTRARYWDREQFRILGERGFLNFAHVLGEIGQTMLEALPACKPQNWKELIWGLRVLGRHLPAETFGALIEAASRSDGVERTRPRPVVTLNGHVNGTNGTSNGKVPGSGGVCSGGSTNGTHTNGTGHPPEPTNGTLPHSG